MLTLLAIILGSAQAETARISIEGMFCVSCQAKVTTALDKLAFVSASSASTASGTACAELSGAVDNDALSKAITQFGYTIANIEIVEACDPNSKRFPENWGDTEGLDAAVISRGETVDLDAHRPDSKWTIFDFGAPWCGPCHAAELLLKAYLRDNSDTALRAIVLDSQDANESFAMPVVAQHLQSAPGLPYFIVMDPKGKTVFKGSDVEKLLQKLDKKK